VSVEQTRRTMDRYFAALDGGDFARVFVDEVTWITADTGDLVHGRTAVRDFIIALHGQMSDSQVRKFVVSDGAAYLEGDCLDARMVTGDRIAYCVAYDVEGDWISAVRAYGPIAAMTPTAGPVGHSPVRRRSGDSST